MYRITFILTVFSSLCCYPQIPEGFPVIDITNLPNADFQDARHFTGVSLYGYMNGGAELYREYGMTDAVITEFDLDNKHYKCEVFKMTGPEEAYGIFSVSKFKCLDSPDFAPYSCRNKYQVQICKGPYYISIINRSGTDVDSMVTLRAARILSDQVTDPSINLRTFIPDQDPEKIKGSAVLVKGKLGLANGSPQWEDYFKYQSGFSTLIYSSDDITILSARFSNTEDFKLFVSFHGWGLCEMSVTDVTISTGETVRLLGDNHMLIRIKPAAAGR